MSAQLSLTYRPAHLGGEAWQRQLAVLRSVVDHLGRKEVAFELDVGGSALSDALAERQGSDGRKRRWYAEWTAVVTAMLALRNDETAGNLLKQLLECATENTALVVDEAIDLTPEESSAVENFVGQLLRRRKKARAR